MIKKIGKRGGKRSGLEMAGSYYFNVKSNSTGDARLDLTHFSEDADPLFLVTNCVYGQIICKYSCFYRSTITQANSNFIRITGSSRGNTFEIDLAQSNVNNCSTGNSIAAVGESFIFNLLDDGRSAFYSEFGGGIGRTVCLKQGAFEIYGIITADDVQIFNRSHSRWNPLQVRIEKL